jgi:uncharacterized protein (DUF1778 family)
MTRKAKEPGRDNKVNATKNLRETLDVRCSDEDKELFKQAAEIEGFLKPNGEPYLSVWVLTHLRRIAKATIRKE